VFTCTERTEDSLFRDSSHPLLRGPVGVGVLSIDRFAFDSHTPSIFIFVRLHDAHRMTSESLSAHFHTNDAARREGWV
jgi:hypothetical protein